MTETLSVLDHLDAVEAILKTAGFDVYLIDVDVKIPAYPYVVLWAPRIVPDGVTLCGARTVIDTSLMVTVAADSARNVLVAQSKCRTILDGARLTVPGRMVEPLVLIGGQGAVPDRDVVVPGTGRHPVFAVDEWRLVSTPTS